MGHTCNLAYITTHLVYAHILYNGIFNAREMAQYIMKFALEDGRFFNGKILPVSQSTP